MNRVLLDQGLAPAAARRLRDCEWDAVHVSEIGLDRADDETILGIALSQGRVCITLDHDFHAHLAITRAGEPSVVFLRIQSVDAETQAELIQSIWAHCADAIREGSAVSADLTEVRVRRLPLR